ncbi:MAG: ABC transporter permease [Sarcina sp.]
MRNIWLIVKGNILRVKKNKLILLMFIIILPVIVALGVYFGSSNETKGTIALIKPTVQEEMLFLNIFKENKGIKIETLQEEIKHTSLITGKYLAAVSFDGEKVNVAKYSNSEIKGVIESIFYGKEYKSSMTMTTVVEKIVGFLMMFLFYGALAAATLSLQDRETGVYIRILSGNVSFFEYTIGQILYMLVIVILPASIISLSMIYLLNIDIKMSYTTFLGIIVLLGALCSSLIIFISSIFKKMNEVQMNAAIIGLITSLFSGCIMNVEGESKIIEGIRNILPQKRLLDFVADFNISDLSFVICSIGIFIIASVYIGKINYKKGVF